ncbi:endonuclease/exonuclease/phosphatase family protein [Medicago truncatula]|uniref:Endonuclease/exonuclease/phosphatase family protein n=1 Tax=Medicago truncatula TaxID=3880 RepID=A0A072VPF9_MEDTR|nr:endonuclease/exonuclease/phosphatase family protein [Medicago truncatula]
MEVVYFVIVIKGFIGIDVESLESLLHVVRPHISYMPLRRYIALGVLIAWDGPMPLDLVQQCVRFRVLHGSMYRSNEEFYLFNIYAPCDRAAQKLLWDSLSLRLQQLRGRKVCVCGDFNDVWCSEERRSVNVRHSSLDFSHFNSFIGDNSLHDLPLGGRKFTWFKGDGRSMSRLDRFLLSEDWCLAWPNCLQLAQLWGLSDHCPLVLSVHEENWGPRPSRLLKCWTDIPGYKQFVGVGIGQARPGFDRPEPGLRNKSQA